MANIIEVTQRNFEQEVLRSPEPVLVDFWAPWCGPCRMMVPILEQLAEELSDKLKIVKLNTDDPEAGDLPMVYDIMGIPNMKLFKSGQVVGDFVGLRPKEHFKRELEAALEV